MKIGSWTWDPIEAGRFRLDGGAMFGNVPKVLWEKSHPADSFNRIEMALRCLLLRGHDRVVLVDTGMGHKWSEKELERFHVDYSQYTLEKSLQEKGVRFEDVTDVILTHLHFDHAGGATRVENGQLIPTFPEAQYYIQKENLETATHPNLRERASYLKENWEPLLEKGVLTVLEKEGEILPDIFVRKSSGHTKGMQVVTVVGDGTTLSYPADMIPLAAHVTPVYTMGYDIEPVRLIEEKNDFYKTVVKSNGLLFFEHDAEMVACEIGQDARGRPCAGRPILEA